MRPPGIARLGLVSAIVILTAVLIAPLPFRLEPNTSISPREAKALLAALRRSLDRDGPARLPDGLERIAADRVPLVLTVWVKGVRRRLWQVEGEPLERAFGSLAGDLREARGLLEHPTARLQLDMATAEGWVPQGGLLFALSFVEGHDGVSGEVAGRRVYLPPTELIRNWRYGGFEPLPGYDARFEVGLDPERVTGTIAHQAGRIGLGKSKEVRDLRRFRALSAVEGSDLVPRRLLKGTVERPPLDRARAEAAVRAGADYLVRAMKPDGTYRYHYDPLRDRDVRDSYNWPRHAGVSYSLALVGRLLGEEAYVRAAGRALERFERQLGEGPGGSRCLRDRGRCYLGSSALGLLALSEHRIASGDGRFEDTARSVARFILEMQRRDGTFFHEWRPDSGIDEELMKLYASQQAVLALARHAEAVGDEGSLDAAVLGMDHLAGPYWDHFLGTFFFGQEHWTCLAAEEIHRARPKAEHARLCHGIGVHYDNITHDPGETPFSEDTGGMSVTHAFTPHLGGTATAAEAMVSAVALGDSLGLDVSDLEDQLVATLGFLAGHQITEHDSFWIRRPGFALGGFFETRTRTRVRIDNVQHAISALVRGMHLLPEGKGR